MLEMSDVEEELSDNEVDEDQHSSLLKSMEEMRGKKRHTSQRTEAYGISEYNIPSAKDRVRLNDLVGALQQNSTRGSLKKQLERVRKRGKVLNTPLPKHEQHKIHRTIAYESTTKEVTKWDPVIEENRQAEQLIFPLEKPDVRMITSPEQIKERTKPRTDLELEVAALLHGSQSTLQRDTVLTPAEERALRAMNLAEARERRRELQKYRALLSYEQAKARRQKKIKSKKFHRILQKEKLKKEEKSIEQMKKNDPEAYLEKLRHLDEERMEERMSLKHRGGSKFARKQALYKKYDDHTREAFQDMLHKSRELTKKVAMETDSSGGEEEEDGVEEVVMRDNNAGSDTNPWMTSGIRLGKKLRRPEAMENKEKVFDEDTDGEEDEGVESGDDEEKNKQKEVDIDVLFDKLEAKNTPSVRQIKSNKYVKKSSDISEESDSDDNLVALEEEAEKIGEAEKEDSDKYVIKDTMEENKASPLEINRKLRSSGGNKINMSLKRKQTMDAFDDSDSDGEQSEDEESNIQREHLQQEPADKPQAQEPRVSGLEVNPKKFMTLSGQSGPVVTEGDSEEEEEDQSLTIAEAFAADDVVEDFVKEKDEIRDRDKPKDIDLSLPGWGDWGGEGIKLNERKRRRFIMKAPPARPRKDRDMDNVIIHEAKDKAIAKHQVKDLPFPFTRPEQFEACIRQPVGNTWNPETAYKKLIEPTVKTKLGTIISPIDKEEVFKNAKTKKNSLPDRTKQDKKGNKNSNKKRKLSAENDIK